MDELEKIKREKILRILKETNKGDIILEVNGPNFEELVIKKSFSKPVIVDFYADWCMPCKILKPSLENVVKKFNGKIVLAKVNVDHARDLSLKYNVMSIPNVKLFRNGKIVAEFIGALSENAIEKWLERNLSDVFI